MLFLYPCELCCTLLQQEQLNTPCPHCGYSNRAPYQEIEMEAIEVTYRKYVWVTCGLIGICVAVIFSFTGCTPAPAPQPPPHVDDPPTLPDPEHGDYDDPVKQTLLDLHATRRKTAGLPQLTPHTRLDSAAQSHAEWMAANDKMSHTGAGGSSFWDRVKKAGYKGRGGGENIAAGYRTPESVLIGWWNSAGHKRNILNPNWDHVGFGHATSQRTGRIYWCTVFAYGHASTGTRALPKPVREELPEPLDTPGQGQNTVWKLLTSR